MSQRYLPARRIRGIRTGAMMTDGRPVSFGPLRARDITAHGGAPVNHIRGRLARAGTYLSENTKGRAGTFKQPMVSSRLPRPGGLKVLPERRNLVSDVIVGSARFVRFGIDKASWWARGLVNGLSRVSRIVIPDQREFLEEEVIKVVEQSKRESLTLECINDEIRRRSNQIQDQLTSVPSVVELSRPSLSRLSTADFDPLDEASLPGPPIENSADSYISRKRQRPPSPQRPSRVVAPVDEDLDYSNETSCKSCRNKPARNKASPTKSARESLNRGGYESKDEPAWERSGSIGGMYPEQIVDVYKSLAGSKGFYPKLNIPEMYRRSKSVFHGDTGPEDNHFALKVKRVCKYSAAEREVMERPADAKSSAKAQRGESLVTGPSSVRADESTEDGTSLSSAIFGIQTAADLEKPTNTTPVVTVSSLFGNTPSEKQRQPEDIDANPKEGSTLMGFSPKPADEQRPASSLFGDKPKEGASHFSSPKKPQEASSLFGDKPKEGASLFSSPKKPQEASSLFGDKPKEGASLFGGEKPQEASSLFGDKPKEGASLFGAEKPQETTSVFGDKPKEGGSLFGAEKPQETSSLFGDKPKEGASLFGGEKPQEASSLFGDKPKEGTSLFGAEKPQDTSSLFGDKPKEGASLFGAEKPQETSLFGDKPQETSLFGDKPKEGGSLFGAEKPQEASSLFGDKPKEGASLFGTAKKPQEASSLFAEKPQEASSLFGDKPKEGESNKLFGETTTSLFGSLPQDAKAKFPAAQSPAPAGPSSLFGGNQPATTGLLGSGPSVFATSAPHDSASNGASLFEGKQPVPKSEQASSLFGGSKPADGNFFGSQASTAEPFGSSQASSFGSQTANNTNFGTQQPQFGSGGGSSFGGAQQAFGQAQSAGFGIQQQNSAFGATKNSQNFFGSIEQSSGNTAGQFGNPEEMRSAGLSSSKKIRIKRKFG